MKHLNNPLNIRYNKANNFFGQLKPSKGFCRFVDMEHGWRAAIKLVLRYRYFGVVTVKDIISRWSSESDNNNTLEYIHFVQCYNRWSDDKMIFDDDIYDLLLSMARIEQGFYDTRWQISLKSALYKWFNIQVYENYFKTF